MGAMNPDLQLAVDALQQMPFPAGSAHEGVDELHAELAEYDGYVAGLAQRALNGERVRLHQLQRDPALRVALESLVRESAEPASHDAARLLTYLNALERVVDAASMQQEPAP